jgi:hypothetical protein
MTPAISSRLHYYAAAVALLGRVGVVPLVDLLLSAVFIHVDTTVATHRSPSRGYHPVLGFLVRECNQAARIVSTQCLLISADWWRLTQSQLLTQVSGGARGPRADAGSVR